MTNLNPYIKYKALKSISKTPDYQSPHILSTTTRIERSLCPNQRKHELRCVTLFLCFRHTQYTHTHNFLITLVVSVYSKGFFFFKSLVAHIKFTMSDINIAKIPASLWLLFACYTFSHPFVFNLFVSLNLKYVSYRKDVFGFCFFFQSGNL